MWIISCDSKLLSVFLLEYNILEGFTPFPASWIFMITVSSSFRTAIMLITKEIALSDRTEKTPAPLLWTALHSERGRQVEKHVVQTQISGGERLDSRPWSCLHTIMAPDNARVTTRIRTCHKALITSGSAFLGRQQNYHSATTKHTLDT